MCIHSKKYNLKLCLFLDSGCIFEKNIKVQRGLFFYCWHIYSFKYGVTVNSAWWMTVGQFSLYLQLILQTAEGSKITNCFFNAKRTTKLTVALMNEIIWNDLTNCCILPVLFLTPALLQVLFCPADSSCLQIFSVCNCYKKLRAWHPFWDQTFRSGFHLLFYGSPLSNPHKRSLFPTLVSDS